MCLLPVIMGCREMRHILRDKSCFCDGKRFRDDAGREGCEKGFLFGLSHEIVDNLRVILM